MKAALLLKIGPSSQHEMQLAIQGLQESRVEQQKRNQKQELINENVGRTATNMHKEIDKLADKQEGRYFRNINQFVS